MQMVIVSLLVSLTSSGSFSSYSDGTAGKAVEPEQTMLSPLLCYIACIGLKVLNNVARLDLSFLQDQASGSQVLGM